MPGKPTYDELVQRIETLEKTQSEWKATEADLRASEEKYRQIFERAPIGIFQTTSDGKPVSINLAMARILGFSSTREALAHYSDIGIQIYKSSKRRDRFLKLLRENGSVDNFEYEAQTADGQTIWLSNNARVSERLEDGTFIIDGFATNITERKRIETALRESEKRFRDFAEMLPEAVYETDRNMVVTFANDQAFTMYGYSRQDFEKGLNAFDMLVPEDRDRGRKNLEKRLQGHEFGVNEYRALRKDGSTFPILQRVSFMTENGELAGLRGIVIDITERKQIEERLRQIQKMEAIGTLAGGIAHDFNNVLQPMMGFCELLKEDLPTDSLQQGFLDEILRAVMRAKDLINQILTFSRQSEHRKIPVSVQKILDEVFKLSRSTIPSNIEITRDIQSDCRWVLADPTQMHQVAMNLMINALHAVENTGGRISIQLKETMLAGDDPTFNSLEPGPYLMLTVSDTGCGIAPSIRDKIFEPYFTTKPQGKGSGIGLAVVYGIVREYGGDIRMHSEVGKGATFIVYLPVWEKAPETLPEEETVRGAVGDERILLVDDDEQVALLEKLMLERLGYRVTLRMSSVDALEAFRANPAGFELVVSDMAMPNMTGEQLAGELIAIRPDVRIIICTGFSENMNQEKAESMGIKGFLMKPVVRKELARMVRQVLDTQGEQ